MQKSVMTTRMVLFGLFAMLCSVFISVAQAETPHTGWLKNSNHTPIETRFVLTGQINKVDQTVAGFLEVRLAGDWKTYWRSPGEGGIAPSMTWEDSQNIRSIDWYWPYPKRFDLLGIETLGYKGSVIFPMTLHIDDLNKPVTFKADLTLSSCTTICVLTDYPFELTFIPADLTLSKEAMHVYAQGLSQVPKESALISDVKAVWDATKMQLQVTASKKMGWITPDVLVDGPSDEMQDANFSRPKIDVDGNNITATFDVSSWMGTPDLTGENISVTLKDSEFIAEQPASISDGVITSSNGLQSILKMILFALFGGLILNVMPCVFPVLGMKLSSVISAQGLEKKQIKLQFLASASGIVFSFWLLASFLVVLKLSGSAIGWGIQFQSAWFIGIMTLITALFGANMLSLFEIRLSSNTNTWIASKGNNSYFGHFIQGMFATLLSTPCSAPFLGTAVAFALATNIPTMYGIFTALALGMALPWILVALFPSIALSLPKPGPWMSKVKYLFGAMMLITSIWLLNLLSNHLSEFWIYAIAAIAGGVILLRTVQVHSKKAAGWLSILFAIAFGFGTVIDSMTSTDLLPEEPKWVPLSSESIQQYVDEGKVVFVDVTADWCVTCKANKIGVLLQEPVYSELNSANIIPMQGDWTVPSEKITSYLQEHGRFGVPFNVVYGPSAPNGIELPVILNEKVVMDAIKKAGNKP
ncbi:protein-disulfide reductase DsbD family protein [Aliivibrio fischeri]|uniref:protein-disulfide reductase DsbD family protein n=1 Tax=Aliivibrio fischeri TaxID=668 RepID=UPI0007C4F2BB|nr:protein-disulfide reductase DsbD domain-containing protein [Aliivibrio fischeri]MCE7537703.1 thioredoxin family protein [Aliivibrio fischeri]MCE7560236.1 thioredoxin family protein [Aliivibrio fischeri]TGA69665.1 cytochrome C biogenesis protein [Aliivibrio fischeri]